MIERSIGLGLALLLGAAPHVAAQQAAPAAKPPVQDALSRAAAAQAAPAEANAARPQDLVVWQGDAKITLSDIDGRMSRIPPDKRSGFINDPERIEQMLRGLLLTRQIALEAEREGLADDAVVAAEIRLAKEEILARRKLSLHMRDLKVPDMTALARERYIASPALYSSKPTIDLRHLLIDSKEHGDAKAKELAHELHAKIAAGELDFEAAIKQHSDDAGAAEDGGLIEDLTPGETLADFNAAAFALKKPGELSPVVPTKYGYHIIRLEKRVEPVRFEFEKVKSQIEQELRQEFVARASQEFLDRWRGNALDADPALVQSLRTRYLPGAPGAQAIERKQGDVPAATEGGTQDGGGDAPPAPKP